MMRLRVLYMLLGLLLTGLPLAAQDTARDPHDLARRFLGVTETLFVPELTPLYGPAEQVEFWVSKASATEPTRITAVLGAATPGVYIFVEEGILFDPQALAQQAALAEQVFTVLRLRDNYGTPTIIPDVGRVTDIRNLLPLSDVDNDPHLYILYAAELGDAQYIINPNHMLPAALVPGGYSNQHEMITINASRLPGGTPGDSSSNTVLTRAIYDFIAFYNAPQQARWLREALGWLIMLEFNSLDLPPGFLASYFQEPAVSLRALTLDGNLNGLLGGQQLFLGYLSQRFGTGIIRDLFSSSGPRPIDEALAQNDFTDPVTAQTITMADVFADFIIANVINAPIGDGRFVHQSMALPEEQGPNGQVITQSLEFSAADQPVGQYGARYYYVGGQSGSFTVSFEGQPHTPRLPFGPTRDAANRFYWSGGEADRSHRLTRRFDLRGISEAALRFDTWHDLAQDWNYLYVTVSADDGATWAILPVEGVSASNRLGLAYGAGLTGPSSREAARPFAYIGVQFEGDGMTVSGIVPDGPASASELAVGDMIIGVDETPWPGPPAILQALEPYRAGDTINLFVQRGGQRLTIPLVLGAHPERVVLPETDWTTHTVDLTPYAGQSILLSFEYISVVNHENPGVAIDNIEIAALNFRDNAESGSDWTFSGWKWIDNLVEQNYVVQMVSSGGDGQPARVRQLIAPADPATSGTWRINLQTNEILVFTVSALSDETDQPARFSLRLDTTN